MYFRGFVSGNKMEVSRETFDILPCSQDDPCLNAILATHEAFAVAHTPEDSGHAIAPGEALPVSLEFHVARVAGEAVGCVGLMAIGPAHGEIKSMHVVRASRGCGVGAALIQAVLSSAVQRGFAKVSLETGRGEGFAASRRLYSRLGFAECPPFGAYREDPFSVCMTRDVSRET